MWLRRVVRPSSGWCVHGCKVCVGVCKACVRRVWHHTAAWRGCVCVKRV